MIILFHRAPEPLKDEKNTLGGNSLLFPCKLMICKSSHMTAHSISPSSLTLPSLSLRLNNSSPNSSNTNPPTSSPPLPQRHESNSPLSYNPTHYYSPPPHPTIHPHSTVPAYFAAYSLATSPAISRARHPEIQLACSGPWLCKVLGRI